MRFQISIALLSAVAVEATGSKKTDILSSILKNKDSLVEGRKQYDEKRRNLAKTTNPNKYGPKFAHPGATTRRKLEEDQQDACDASFLRCLPEFECVDCFVTLELEGIDWAGVTPDTSCDDVVKFLTDKDHCESLNDKKSAVDAFCNTFESCVEWEDEDTNAFWDIDDDGFSMDEEWVNCTALTECNWPGMKRNWLGDGICHDNMHGCYNTALCGFDGGDCCYDTCEQEEEDAAVDDFTYKVCGSNGYACRDPKSEKCDSFLTSKCPRKKDDMPAPVSCADGEQKYRLVMYDSFGDGWDTTMLTVSDAASKKEVYKGQLKDGSQGTEYICLSKSPSCYNVVTKGGVWGVEVSWEIRPMSEGSPAIAGGGAPHTCDFPVAGSNCDKTCEGRPEVDPSSDPDYKSFKDLYNCIEKKCLIQLSTCEQDPVCEACFEDDAPEYCFGIDSFVAVVDCSMCGCTEKENSLYCLSKDGPGSTTPNLPPPPDQEDNTMPDRCSPKETMAGAKSVLDFANCANMDEIGVMVTEFDQNNFGPLDAFELCSHSFANEESNGGHTALGCMKILRDASENPIVKDNDKAPLDAIKALASDLYNNGEAFCKCAMDANDACPLCPSFMSFKTLLFESLDACQALDEIDCDAWNEFWLPCQKQLTADFGKVDFRNQEQCVYAKTGCGGAGPFPAFRKLDCEKELGSDAWDFYRKFSNGCLKGSDGIPPTVQPAGSPVRTPTKAPINPPTNAPVNQPTPDEKQPTNDVPQPTLKPYHPSDDTNPKPYIPEDQRDSSSDGKKKKKKSHFFRNLFILCLLGAGGYYIYKRRFDSFNFVQYRRARNQGYGMVFGGAGMGAPQDPSMYNNLNSSTNFEPPSLPPTPMAMGTEMT